MQVFFLLLVLCDGMLLTTGLIFFQGEKSRTAAIHLHCWNRSLADAKNLLQDFPKMRFGLILGNFEG